MWMLAIVDAVDGHRRSWPSGCACGRSGRSGPALEGAFLRGAWYINELYDAVFGRPERAAGRVLRRRGRPEGHRRRRQRGGRRFRGSGALLRRTQTGYVRNYVLGIAFGTVVVLGFMLTRLWWG